MKVLIFYLTISIMPLLIASEKEGYRFRGNVSKDYYTDMESVMEIDAGPFTFAFNSNFKLSHHFISNNELDKNIEVTSTYTNVIATTKLDDKVEINDDLLKLNGTSVTYQIDPLSGHFISKKQDARSSMLGQDDDGLSYEEKFTNTLYPLGPDSIRYINETWIVDQEHTFNGEQMFTFEEFSGTVKIRTHYTLKKVKEKKSKLIAYIKEESRSEIMGTGITPKGDPIEMNQTIITLGNIKFNLNNGLMEYRKQTGSSTSDLKFLEDDKTETMHLSLINKLKQKIK